MKKLLTLTLLFLVLFGCGGGTKLEGKFLTEGVVVTYEPSVDKVFPYKTEIDALTDFVSGGQTSSSHIKSVEEIDLKVVKADESEVGINLYYKSSEVGMFSNGHYEKSEEEDETIGQNLTVFINRDDGKMLRWEGLEDLEYDEAGMSEGDAMANTYASFTFDHFPREAIKVGSKWEVVNETTTEMEDGKESTDNRIKSYEVVDFVLYKGRKCVKCNITLVVEVEGSGTFETDDGEKYEVSSVGTGEGEGDIIFDFENGILVESNLAWVVDVERNFKNIDTGEEDGYELFQESHEKYMLVQ